MRDAVALAGLDLGVLALALHPWRRVKRGAGEHDVAVAFAGVMFRPRASLCADEDGVAVVVATAAL